MKLIRSLSASTIESISHALKSDRLKPPYHAFTVAELGPQAIREVLASELRSLQALGFTTGTLGMTLEALAEEAAARQRAIDQIQMVWTSPDEEGAHVRDTSVVVRHPCPKPADHSGSPRTTSSTARTCSCPSRKPGCYVPNSKSS